MKIGSAFPSEYLKAADLQGRRVKVVISGLSHEEIGDGVKAVLHFAGKDKGLVLNKTNANMIAEVLGSDETDDWQGATITLFPTKVEYQGKRVDAIRVDDSQGATVRVPKVIQADPTITDEDIPF